MAVINKKLTGQIIGCAFEVHNVLGFGFREKTYERGLVEELLQRGIATDQQKRFPVFYKGIQIDDYVPDLLVGQEIIVEIKCSDGIRDEHIGQVLNYLRIANLKLGLILNFKNPRLEIKRVLAPSEKTLCSSV